MLITVVGWVTLLSGLYRMLAPDAPQAARAAPTYAVLAALFAVGLVLTFKAYRPASRGHSIPS